MANRQSVSSILKPPKIRPPLKEIEPIDQDADENTATLSKRKVSFSGMNKIKMYSTGATSLTVNQAPMFDEQISMLSDSSNAEKTKLSGKFEKSDGQITLESTNCTNLENNGCVVIEYESPNDNNTEAGMEMTEVLSGKIFSSTTIYSIDNDGSKYVDCNSDTLESSMEMTEAVKFGQILTDDIESDFNSTEMSVTFNGDNEQLETHFDPKLSSPDIEKSSNVTSYSGCINFTSENIKSNLMDQSCINTQSSCNMELTCVTVKSQKFDLLYENESCSMQSNELSLTQANTENCDQQSDIMELEISSNEENKNCKSQILKNDIFFNKTCEINDNHQISNPTLKNVNCVDVIDDKLSLSMVSMDVDPTLECNEINDILVDYNNSELVVNDNSSIVPVTNKIVNSEYPVESEQENYSNEIDISNQYKSRTSTVPINPSFDQEIFAEKNTINQVVVQELKTTSYADLNCDLEQNQNIVKDTSMGDKKHQQKKYSRRTMVHTILPINQDTSSKIKVITENMTEIAEETQQNACSRMSVASKSIFDPAQSLENESNSSVLEKECSSKLIAPTSVNQTQPYVSDKLSDKLAITEENKHDNLYFRKSIAPLPVYNQCQSTEVSLSNSSLHDQTHFLQEGDTSDKSVIVEENVQKRYSRKTIGPISVFPDEYSEDSISDNSMTTEESNKSNSRILVASAASESIGNTSLISNNSNIQQMDASSLASEENISKNVEKLVLLNVIGDDDLNSPFRKKSRKSLAPIQLKKQTIDHTNTLLNDNENMSEVIDEDEDNLLDNFENVSKMDVSVEHVSVHDYMENISSQEVSMTLPSYPINELSHNYQKISDYSANIDENSSSSINDLLKQKSIKIDQSLSEERNLNQFLDISMEANLQNIENNEYDDRYEMDKEQSVLEPHVSDKNVSQVGVNRMLKENVEKNTKEPNVDVQVKGNIIEVNQILDSKNNISRNSTSSVIEEICIEDISNMSISDKTSKNYDKSFPETRKRSYSNRDCAPLSCSSFVIKSKTHNSTNVDFINESPIKKDIVKQHSLIEESIVDNALEVDIINEESNKEQLSNEVKVFLEKWNDIFIEQNLVIDKCTNSEWIFSLLDKNIVLKITYFPISNEHSFLRVKDIFLTPNIVNQNEITKFGISWIMSKYNPKVYKQICFTTRDVDLLLQSLIDDIQFISKSMINMFYVSDAYCVTFKDNKAKFVLHSMNCLLMVNIEISLFNIHKLSIKDITVDCLFGSFNINVLNEIIESVNKDCNVLQSFIEKLKDLYR